MRTEGTYVPMLPLDWYGATLARGIVHSLAASMQAPPVGPQYAIPVQQIRVVGRRVHVGLGAGHRVVGQRGRLRHRTLDRVDDELALRNDLGVLVHVPGRLLPSQCSRGDHARAAVELVKRRSGVTGPIGGELDVVRPVELIGVVGDVRIEGVRRPAVGVPGPHDRQLSVDRKAVGMVGALAVLPDEGPDAAVGGPDLRRLHVGRGIVDGLDRRIPELLHVGRIGLTPDPRRRRGGVGVG